MRYDAIVIGASAGGVEAIKIILEDLPIDYPIPIIIVLHMGIDFKTSIVEYFNDQFNLEVKCALEMKKVSKGVWIAPQDYHLFIENSGTFSISHGEKELYSRPSIDLLFKSAAEVYKNKLVGILLTGTNNDGTNGLKIIKKFKGFTIVQNPKMAYEPKMPQSAIDNLEVDGIKTLQEIKYLLKELAEHGY